MAMLRQREFSSALFESTEDEERFMGIWGARRRPRPKDPNRFPKVPSEEGTELMRSGAFGANDADLRARQRINRRMLERELGLGDGTERRRNSDMMKQAGPPALALALVPAPAPNVR